MGIIIRTVRKSFAEPTSCVRMMVRTSDDAQTSISLTSMLDHRVVQYGSGRSFAGVNLASAIFFRKHGILIIEESERHLVQGPSGSSGFRTHWGSIRSCAYAVLLWGLLCSSEICIVHIPQVLGYKQSQLSRLGHKIDVASCLGESAFLPWLE